MTEPMPPDIATAIVKVMAGVKKLAKDEKNQFAKYDFVSIDNFLEAVNPLCAEAGLFFVMDETAWEIKKAPNEHGKDVGWLYMTYDVMLAHAGGSLYGPLRRNVIVQASGAQAFGSAQSYVLKQLMRGLFQIPTGDKDDPDFGDKGNPPAKGRKEDTKPKETTPFDEPRTNNGSTSGSQGASRTGGQGAGSKDAGTGEPVISRDENDPMFVSVQNGDKGMDWKRWCDDIVSIAKTLRSNAEFGRLGHENRVAFGNLKRADSGLYEGIGLELSSMKTELERQAARMQ